ncbi:hypothetical protein BHE74_00005107 [Ensete ventricosum]|nr:hypothetical protein BHE74_00005107 [Ensete ventricosum]RZR80542.1 hypothetical protein BHM03_00006589 [Ensete ventricosum]
MQLFSSPKSQFPLFPSPSSPNPSPNPNLIPRSFAHLPIRSFSSLPLLRSPPSSSKTSSPAPLQEQLLSSVSDDEEEDAKEIDEGLEDPDAGGGPEGLLVVRRPVKEGLEEAAVSSLVESDETSRREEKTTPSSNIDRRLSEFAKKMPMFEPERVVGARERPLGINLELALYRAKVLIRNFQFKEAEEILLKVPFLAFHSLVCCSCAASHFGLKMDEPTWPRESFYASSQSLQKLGMGSGRNATTEQLHCSKALRGDKFFSRLGDGWSGKKETLTQQGNFTEGLYQSIQLLRVLLVAFR